MPAFRPRHLSNKQTNEPINRPPKIDNVNDFPDLGGNTKKETPQQPQVKSWANLIKEDETDELLNPVLDAKPIITETTIDYFENDIDNTFDITYSDICYDISNKIQEFCYTNALPMYNTRSKLPNLIEFIKNTSSALDIIIEDYDKDDDDVVEDELYESDESLET
jgi:hypothetical protein